MSSTSCAVRGCDSPSETVFEHRPGGDGPLLEWMVCAFHHRDLSLAGAWSLTPDDNEILMGTDAPLDVVSFEVQRTAADLATVTLKLGHDGVQTDSIQVRIDPQTLHQICYWAANGPHGDAFDPPLSNG